MMKHPLVLSHVQAGLLLAAKKLKKAETPCSPNLGVSCENVRIDNDGAWFSGYPMVSWEDIERIRKSSTNCFILGKDGMRKIILFSEESGKTYSLYPTEGAPTMLISGILMHRIKGTDPMKDTREKIHAIRPAAGRVLDTATGLGYTAILAAKTAERIDTIEIEPAAQEIARQNPWSKELFENPKIHQHMGDAFQVVDRFAAGSFSRIVHDPPVINIAGMLYSAEFYRKLSGLLIPGGRLFHYIGNPGTKTGAKTTKGVVRRLRDVGFIKIKPAPDAFGVTAVKP